MELNTSREAICAATQELDSISWNQKVYNRVHKGPAPVPILSQINPVHTTISARFILILSTHLGLDLPSGLFPSGFSTSNLFVFLFSQVVLLALPLP
jgi:hypothetical protein